jgi:hypothetical protein
VLPAPATREVIQGDCNPHGEWETDRLPNCTIPGIEVRLCAVCNMVADEKDIPIVPEAHDLFSDRGSMWTLPVKTKQVCKIQGCDYKSDPQVDILVTILGGLVYLIIAGIFITIVALIIYSKRKIATERAKIKCPYCFKEFKKKDVKRACRECGNDMKTADKKGNSCQCTGKLLVCDKCNRKPNSNNIVDGSKCVNAECSGTYINTSGMFKCNICDEELNTDQIINKIVDLSHCVVKECNGKYIEKKCTNKIPILLCPHSCNKGEIPKKLFSNVVEHLPFSILGVSRSGKTHFITVMLDVLGQPGLSKLNITMESLTTETEKHQRKHKEWLIKNKVTLPSTTDMETPQIWLLNNQYRKKGKLIDQYVFTIYDGAGEKQVNFDPNESEYVGMSKAIILVFNPFELKEFIAKGKINPNDVKRAQGGDHVAEVDVDIVTKNFGKFIRDHVLELEDGQTLPIKCAVVLTKIDMLNQPELLGDSSIFKKSQVEVSKEGKLDISEIDTISNEIRNWIGQDPDGQTFITTLDGCFDEVTFFGVSSLGQNPLEDEITEADNIKINDGTPTGILIKGHKLASKPNPRRVLDPLLWILHKNEFID